MQLATIVTLIGVALTVVALAVALIGVALMLRSVSFTLGTIIAALRAIAHQAQPLDGVLGQINRDLEASREALEGVLARRQGATRRG